MGSVLLAGLADPGKVFDQFAGGATIVLQSLQRYWPPLTTFSRQLELFLTHPVQVNAYLTPPSSRGLGVHHDTHDVFVLQVHGRKLLAGLGCGRAVPPGPPEDAAPRGPAPAEPPLLDAELAPGDCLYVPRGFRHAARTAETASLHLTVGMLTRNWDDLLREVVELATEEAWFREACPSGSPATRPASRPAWPTGWRSCAASSTRSTWPRWPTGPPGILADRPPPLEGQLGALLGLEELDDDTVLARRPGSHLAAARHRRAPPAPAAATARLTMPAALEPAVRSSWPPTAAPRPTWPGTWTGPAGWAGPRGWSARAAAAPLAEELPCATLSRALGEPLSAPPPGSGAGCCWSSRGRGAATPSPRAASTPAWPAPSRAAAAAHLRLLLIRRPGRAGRPAAHTCFVAHTSRAGRWLERRRLDDPAELLELDMPGVAGERPGFGEEVTEPVYLVCTNGRHDRCCATYGAAAGPGPAAATAELVWESSHVGGDRFAGNLVCLPGGHLLRAGRARPTPSRWSPCTARAPSTSTTTGAAASTRRPCRRPSGSPAPGPG